MAMTELNFKKDANDRFWETSFVSTGERMAIELNRKKEGWCAIYGNIEGMSREMLHSFSTTAHRNLLFEVDVPSGVTVTIVSLSEVTMAKSTAE